MTVADLNATMSQAEFVMWGVYHARRAQALELEMLKAKGGAGN